MFLDAMVASKQQNSSRLYVALFASAVLGFVIACYLLFEESGDSNEPRACDIDQIISCTRVLESPFSRLFGVPVSLLGIVRWLRSRFCCAVRQQAAELKIEFSHRLIFSVGI